MYTLMHIGDLHRSEADPISNDELLSCLLKDRERFLTEEPRISVPDAIVVSGDLVYGLPLGANNYPDALREQYEEASELLARLADNFVKGDRSRVIIVPGNHDVDWNKSREAMTCIQPNELGGNQNIPNLLSMRNSPYRWSWDTLELFKLTNPSVYEDRFKYFCDMYSEFYKSASLTFELDPNQEWNLFSLDDGRIIVCAFNSCVSNDCFRPVGEISLQAISQSDLTFRECGVSQVLRIAVWHHNIKGPPMRQDYIDDISVGLMIDRDYRLAIHAHQHKSDALPYSIYATEEYTMPVISVGSLCADSRNLPSGFNRQYNIIEILDDYLHARLHVREMTSPSIFAPGRLPALGGHKYADLRWSPVAPSPIVNIARGGRTILATVEKFEELIHKGAYKDAIASINEGGDTLPAYLRKSLSEALFEDKKWDLLEEFLLNPQNDGELTKLVFATIALKHWTVGQKALLAARETGNFSPTTIDELTHRFNAEKGMSE